MTLKSRTKLQIQKELRNCYQYQITTALLFIPLMTLHQQIHQTIQLPHHLICALWEFCCLATVERITVFQGFPPPESKMYQHVLCVGREFDHRIMPGTSVTTYLVLKRAALIAIEMASYRFPSHCSSCGNKQNKRCHKHDPTTCSYSLMNNFIPYTHPSQTNVNILNPIESIK